MKIFQIAKWGIRDDYGTEVYFTFLTTKRYSFLQVAFDVGELSKWYEFPYFQMSLGNGRLLSVLFTISKFGISVDLFGRNWRDELFYVQPGEKNE